MSELIDRQTFIERERKLYCEDCDRRKGMKNGKPNVICYEIGEAPCRACWLDDTLTDLEDFPTVSPWHRVEDGLPKESNRYIVYLRQGTEMKTPDWMGGEPLSYVTEMGFDKEQMLWQNGDDAYNAILSAVDTKKDFHITHWTEKPEPPKEIMNE